MGRIFLVFVLAAPMLISQQSDISGQSDKMRVRPSVPNQIVRAPLRGGTTKTVVKAGDDLQAAIDAAKPGNTLELQAGAVFEGNFKLPVKGGSEYITLTTAAAQNLPPGKRVGPAELRHAAALHSPNTMPALTVASGAHHYRLIGLKFAAPGYYSSGIVTVDSTGVGSKEQLAHDIEFDRVWVVGDPAKGAKRGVLLNGEFVKVTNSYIADIKSAGQDSQAICGWSMGNAVIENNYLEASGENVFLSELSSIPDFWPHDVAITRNHIVKPLKWFEGTDVATLNDGRTKKWAAKNSIELKSGIRVTIRGNVIENNWRSAQTGFLIVLKPGASASTNPARTEDVVIEDNLGIGGNGALAITGFAASVTAGIAPGTLSKVIVRNNAFIGMPSPETTAATRIIQIIGSPANELTFERNTFVAHSGALALALPRSKTPSAGFRFRRNIISYLKYGVKRDGGASGLAALQGAFPDAWEWTDNVLIGGTGKERLFPTRTKLAANVEFGPDGYTQTSYPDVGVDAPRLVSAIDGVR